MNVIINTYIVALGTQFLKHEVFGPSGLIARFLLALGAASKVHTKRVRLECSSGIKAAKP